MRELVIKSDFFSFVTVYELGRCPCRVSRAGYKTVCVLGSNFITIIYAYICLNIGPQTHKWYWCWFPCGSEGEFSFLQVARAFFRLGTLQQFGSYEEGTRPCTQCGLGKKKWAFLDYWGRVSSLWVPQENLFWWGVVFFLESCRVCAYVELEWVLQVSPGCLVSWVHELRARVIGLCCWE